MQNSALKRPEPPAENLARVGSQPFKMHVQRGRALLKILEAEIEQQNKSIDSQSRIYDFGCGVGRVVVPFAEKHIAQLYGSDVDPTAIDFLNEHFSSKFTAVTTDYEPPLPVEDNFFDIIYSISVWSHFPAHLQIVWLLEMKRILKKDALLLISITGVAHLENWHAKGKRNDITTEMLRERGALFIKNEALEKRPEMFPGVTGDWGVYYQTTDFIRDNWSQHFKIEAVREATIGKQDLVVLRKL